MEVILYRFKEGFLSRRVEEINWARDVAGILFGSTRRGLDWLYVAWNSEERGILSIHSDWILIGSKTWYFRDSNNELLVFILVEEKRISNSYNYNN